MAGPAPAPKPTPTPMPAPKGKLPKRLMWFAAIWLASVLTLTVVAYGIRLMIMP